MKLFVTDLDGTLLNKDFSISRTNMEAIHKLLEHKVLFAVATGRIYHDAMTICLRQQLWPYIIANNGACIFDMDHNQIYGRWMVHTELKQLTAYLDNIEVCYGIGGGRRYVTSPGWERIMDREIERLNGENVVIPEKKVSFAKHEMTAQNGFCEMDLAKELAEGGLKGYSVSVVTYDNVKMQKILDYVSRIPNLTATVSGNQNLEIMRKDGTKGHAIRYLAEMLKLDRSDVAAIGDSYNDLPMLTYAGTSIAMGNSKEDVKRVCSFTTGDCMEDGFALAVERLLKGK